jgi:lipopolysaccharide biosynthesis glycosyltransferase
MSLSVACYYRLFIPQIFTAYRRMLYLDVDLVALTDVAKLFDTDLKGKSIGAVRDSGIVNWKSVAERAKLLKGAEWQKYFNSGVLLFDIQKTLKRDLIGKLLSYLSSCKNNTGIFFEDQDALNAVCGDDVQLIDERWNVLSYCSAKDMIPAKDILIMHYVGCKPWKENLKLDDLWWKYAEKTPYYRRLVLGKYLIHIPAKAIKDCYLYLLKAAMFIYLYLLKAAMFILNLTS